MLSIEWCRRMYRFRDFLRKSLDPQSRILFRNSTWVFIAHMISVASVIAQSIVLSRLLGAKLYGTYVIIVVFVVTVQEFLNFNVGSPFIKFVAEYKSGQANNKIAAFVKGSYFAATIGAIASVIVITVIVLLPFNASVKPLGLEFYILAFAVGRSVRFFDNISISLLRLYNRFRLSSIIMIFLALLELSVISLTAYFYRMELSALFLALFASNLIHGFALNGTAIWECRSILKPHRHVKLSVLKNQWKEIRNFFLSNSCSRTIRTLNSRGDILILGVFSGPEQVAFYSVGKKLAYSILLITDAMYTSIYPQLAQLIAQKRKADVRRMLKKLSKIIVVPISVFLGITLLFNKEIMVRVYGSEYAAAGNTFFLLIWASCIAAFLFWLTPLVMSLGKAVLRFKIDVVMLGIGAPLTVLLASQYGAVGVAIALLTTTVVAHSIFLYISAKELNRA